MSSPLSTQDHAARQKVMMRLRAWMDQHGVTRQQVAGILGITKGHLSTLLNANRTATERQCLEAESLMGGASTLKPSEPKVAKKKPKRPKPEPEPKRTPKANNLRPLTKLEADFVTTVARSWVKANPDSSPDQFVNIVRALSNGIRT